MPSPKQTPTTFNQEAEYAKALEVLAKLDESRRQASKKSSPAGPQTGPHMPLAGFVSNFMAAMEKESANTMRSYLTGTGMFFEFLQETLREPLERHSLYPLVTQSQTPRRKTLWEFHGVAGVLRSVTPTLLDRFEIRLTAESDAKRSTIRQRRRAVNTMLRVAARDEVLSPSQITLLLIKPYKPRSRREQRIVGRRLSSEEVQRLLGAIESERSHRIAAAEGYPRDTRLASVLPLRDRLMICLMLYLGLRTIEVVSLNLGDFRLEGGQWHVLVSGKGSKERKLMLHPDLLPILQEWLDQVNEIAGDEQVLALGGGETTPLLYSLFKNGRLRKSTNGLFTRMARNVIPDRLAYYGHLAGIAASDGRNRLSPHDLRRTCGRNAYENGATLAEIQKLYGHESVEVTMMYLGIEQSASGNAVSAVSYSV